MGLFERGMGVVVGFASACEEGGELLLWGFGGLSG